MKCLNCGSECSDGGGFCYNCGSKLTSPQQPQQAQQVFQQSQNTGFEAPKKSKNKLIAIILIIVGLLIVAAGAFVVLDGFDVLSSPDFFSFLSDKEDKEDENGEEDTDKEKNTEKGTSNKEYEDVTVSSNTSDDEQTTAPSDKNPSDVKIGFIFLHDENSEYDLNFMYAVEEMKREIKYENVQVIFKTNVPESNACYDAAVELIEVDGCDIIFANSFGHEDFMIMAAKEYPDVEFCHATGTKAHTEGLPNFHNAYAAVHEGRYLTGVLAGLKLNEMIENGEITADEAKMGFVGTFTYAEVISGYTAFYLGAKSVCPQVTMDVKFTGSWFDEISEKEAAYELIDRGCVIISQHSNSLGAPLACEERGIPNIVNGSATDEFCPDTFLAMCNIEWDGYFKYIVDQYINGEEIATDWCGSFEEDALMVDFSYDVPDEYIVIIEQLAMEINNGREKVFDTSSFTVNGERVTSYLANVDEDSSFTPDTEVIDDGEFRESYFRAAPYFDLKIDGITLLNEIF